MDNVLVFKIIICMSMVTLSLTLQCSSMVLNSGSTTMLGGHFDHYGGLGRNA